jgi:PEP-CTERM motif
LVKSVQVMYARHLFGNELKRETNMNELKKIAALTAIATSVAAFSSNAAAVIIETYSQSISGNSNFGTFRVPSPVFDLFIGGIQVPFPSLAGSGLVDVTHHSTAISGSLADSSSLTNTYNLLGDTLTFVGFSSANAQFGKVGAQAHATIDALGNNLSVDGTQAFGLFRESYTFTSPTHANGTAGLMSFTFGIDGRLTTTNAPLRVTTSDFEVMYKVGAGPSTTLFRGQVSNSNVAPFLIAPATGSVTGYTVGPGTASGGGNFNTFTFEFAYGTPFDFSLGLLAYVIPGAGGTGDVDFSSTAVLNGISVRTTAGADVTDFNIASGSGTFYDANGVRLDTVSSVPEPESYAMILAGLGLLGFFRQRGKLKQTT